MDISKLAEILNDLQSKENNGRGISAIRGTVSDLLRGDLEGAKQGIRTDWDKIRNYPSIASLLKKELFPNERHMGYEDFNGDWIQ